MKKETKLQELERRIAILEGRTIHIFYPIPYPNGGGVGAGGSVICMWCKQTYNPNHVHQCSGMQPYSTS